MGGDPFPGPAMTPLVGSLLAFLGAELVNITGDTYLTVVSLPSNLADRPPKKRQEGL